MTRWNHRAWGSAADPIRQSDLNSIASQNGCARRFAFDKMADAAGESLPERAHWKRVMGTAGHRVIERGLTRTWPVLLQAFGPGSPRPAGAPPNWAPRPLRARIDEVLRDELAIAANGELIEWRDDNPETQIAAAVDMIVGAFRTTVERARRIVAVEAPFHVVLDGYHLVGTIDCLYEPVNAPLGAVALADWKFGERKLAQVVLDYGYQTSIYGHAVAEGEIFGSGVRLEEVLKRLRGEPNEAGDPTHIGVFPSATHVVHLRDFVPYVKGPKTGRLRGSAWYQAKRSPDDVGRLRVSLRTVVGTVRMGRFLEQIGEQCARCPFRGPCLGDGHQLPANDARELERALEGLDLSDVLPDVA